MEQEPLGRPKDGSGTVNRRDEMGRLLQRVSKRVLRSRMPAQQAGSVDDSYSIHLRAAKEFRQKGRHAEAATRFRRALLEDPKRPITWIDYGYECIAVGKGAAAHEAFANALDLDPSNVRALEMYIDIALQSNEHRSILKQKIGNALAHCTNNHGRELELLDYAIPYGVLKSKVTFEQAILNRANSVKYVAEDLERSESELSNYIGSEAYNDVLIRVAVLKGRFSFADKIMKRTPSEKLPIDTIRRSMKRLAAQGRYVPAKMLTGHMLRADRNDSLAKRRWDELETQYRTSKAGAEKSEILSNGFPLPPRNTQGGYVPNGSVLYLLHNSLPYSSAGYATRSHGLISNIRNSGIDIAGVTRPGYPFDRPEAKNSESKIPKMQLVGDTPYYRLGTEFEKIPKSPLVPYIYEYSSRLEQLAIERNTSLIHAASNHWNGLASVVAARRLGIPNVYEVRGLWEITRISREPEWEGTLDYDFMAGMEAEAAINSTRVIAITGALKNEMVKRGVPEDNIDIVPNGVDTSRFVPMAPDINLKDSLGLAGKTIIGYVGSVLDYEGIDILLDSVRILAAERVDFHVLIVGDGAYHSNAVSRATSLGIDELVTFVGRVPHDEVERYYSIIDIAPIPRRSLPVTEMVSPLKPFEAMAMGKVVVGSNVEAIDEIIVPEVNGLVFEKDNPADLAQVFYRLMGDPVARHELGSSAREWVTENRDWATLSARVVNIYSELF